MQPPRKSPSPSNLQYQQMVLEPHEPKSQIDSKFCGINNNGYCFFGMLPSVSTRMGGVL